MCVNTCVGVHTGLELCEHACGCGRRSVAGRGVGAEEGRALVALAVGIPAGSPGRLPVHREGAGAPSPCAGQGGAGAHAPGHRAILRCWPSEPPSCPCEGSPSPLAAASVPWARLGGAVRGAPFCTGLRCAPQGPPSFRQLLCPHASALPAGGARGSWMPEDRSQACDLSAIGTSPNRTPSVKPQGQDVPWVSHRLPDPGLEESSGGCGQRGAAPTQMSFWRAYPLTWAPPRLGSSSPPILAPLQHPSSGSRLSSVAQPHGWGRAACTVSAPLRDAGCWFIRSAASSVLEKPAAHAQEHGRPCTLTPCCPDGLELEWPAPHPGTLGKLPRPPPPSPFPGRSQRGSRGRQWTRSGRQPHCHCGRSQRAHGWAAGALPAAGGPTGRPGRGQNHAGQHWRHRPLSSHRPVPPAAEPRAPGSPLLPPLCACVGPWTSSLRSRLGLGLYV